MKPKTILILSFVFIAAANALVYAPSLHTAARSDQVAYLTEMAELDSLGDIVKASISYTRTREIYVGDEAYFRPLLYLTLAIERHFFKYQFHYWQLVGILIHLGVVGALLHLLYKIRPHRFLSGKFALFFSLIFLCTDAVSFNNINMYMACFGLVLVALSNLVDRLRGQTQSIWPALTAMTLACLCNEAGVIICILIVWLLWMAAPKMKFKRSFAFVFLIPAGIYCTVSAADYLIRNQSAGLMFSSTGIPQRLDILQWGENFIMTILMGTFLPFITEIFVLFWKDRTILSFITGIAYNKHEQMLFLTRHQWTIALNIIVCLLGLYCIGLLARNYRDVLKKKAQIDADGMTVNVLFRLGLVVAAAYALALSFIRSEREFTAYLYSGTYHFYPICLFLTISGYCAACRIADSAYAGRKKVLKLIGAILLITALTNGIRIYNLNQSGKQASAPFLALLNRVEELVEAHKDEPGFSFRIREADDICKPLLTIYDRKKPITGRLACPIEYYYWQYYEKDNPRYIITPAAITLNKEDG